jgi:RNA polymerase sigma-70 factor, ECF subfamily
MDQAAFRAFYEKTAPRLRAYIARSCGSIDTADDILQEVFLKFLRTCDKIDQRGMRAYLYRTADSVIVDHWRRHQRELRHLEFPFQPVNTSVHDNTDDLKTAFAELNPQQRSLLWLAYVEQCDHREIAAAVGVKEKSVRVLLFRARKTLAALLERKSIGPEIA